MWHLFFGDWSQSKKLSEIKPSLARIFSTCMYSCKHCILHTYVCENVGMALKIYFSCILGKTHNGENDRNVNNVSSTASNKSQNSLGGASDPMLPCEFCDGLVPMRKLLEHQVCISY